MFCLTKRAAVQQAESEQATRSRVVISRKFRLTICPKMLKEHISNMKRLGGKETIKGKRLAQAPGENIAIEKERYQAITQNIKDLTIVNMM